LTPFNRYITEARYPADVEAEFSLDEAKQAVDVTERVRDLVYQKLTD
jgi:hypothetical protein